MTITKALWTSAGWVLLSLLFAAGIYHFLGPNRAYTWLTCYVVEKSLSVDNLLVFSLLFVYFGVPNVEQAKYLYYGILGSVIMRGAFIGAGIALINCFHWLYFVCGVFLVYTASKMLTAGEDDSPKFDTSWIYKLLKDKVSMFWVIVAVLEVTDIAFATDSVPAALAISNDTFIVWSSNVFAVLGLRSMYFVLLAGMANLNGLKYGVSAVLCLVGLKMLVPLLVLLEGLSTGVWLGAIGGVLGLSVLAGLVWKSHAPILTEA